MIPTGNMNDPFNPFTDLDSQMEAMENYRKRLQLLKSMQNQQGLQSPIWDEIDSEVNPLSDDQKERLLSNEEYYNNYVAIQVLVQREILNIVKARIENTPEGKELLQHQLRVVKKIKDKIIDDTNREMDLFKRFKEYSKSNPGVTYEEFLKASM